MGFVFLSDHFEYAAQNNCLNWKQTLKSAAHNRQGKEYVHPKQIYAQTNFVCFLQLP